MKLQVLPEIFTVYKVEELSSEILKNDRVFVAVTPEEKSIVCPSELVIKNVLAKEDGWRGLFIGGTLDFSLIGILAGISTVLSQEKIGIFVVSTYNTDYIFVKEENFSAAVTALKNHGYSFEE